jgi:KDO2-lipid IV(A) lauroyltransferase
MRKRKKRNSWFRIYLYNIAGQPFLRLFHFFVILFPLEISTFLSEKLGRISYFFMPKYRNRAMKNLRRAFGHTKNRRERKMICRSIARNAFKDIVEVFYSTGPDQLKIAQRISIQGQENLKEALSSGRGVIAVSAHLGNFSLIGFGLVSRGYPVHVVIRPVREQAIEKILHEYRKKQGTSFISTIPPQDSVKKMLKALRRNEIICLLVDQAKKHGSVFADFFGRPAATTITPALLSLRTGAPVVPVFIVRNENDTHHIFIEPAIKIEMTDDHDENIFRITVEINKIIQTYVEKYPDQWSYWTARRWKYQPEDVKQSAKNQATSD